MLIDTHSHLNFSDFDKDRDEVIKKCLDNNVWLINVGVDFKTSKKAIEIAEKYKKGVYATVGLHPTSENLDGFDYEKYKKLAQNSKVVAIGEIGLDYKYPTDKNAQKQALIEQIKLAKELSLPMIIHCRFAHNDLIKILSQDLHTSGLCKLKGVVHCFTGTLQEAEKYLALGFYIGFTGIIFRKTKGIDFEKIIKKIPLNRILIETDCPYLTPPDFKEKRNNPLAVKFVAEYIAKIKNESFDKIAETTFQNAKELFKI
ncbi:TatD family hydrolase [Candidatus Parcubacteria bacterium]|nr:TatD family hydrolase [Candidatus Parcubacteria bacterium]